MLLRIAVCDDSLESARSLEKQIRQQAMTLCIVETECFTTADELLDGLRSVAFDVLFLDIRLGRNQDGISVARQINALFPAVQIVFVTNYLQYAVSIYDASHVYFLTKPVSDKRLRRALEQTLRRIESDRTVRFTLPIHGQGQRVFTAGEITYFERHGHTTRIHTVSGVFDTGQKLVELEPLLPTGGFSRPHNSYLVNLMQVCALTKNTVTLRDGIVLPISNAHRAAFTEALVRSVANLS